MKAKIISEPSPVPAYNSVYRSWGFKFLRDLHFVDACENSRVIPAGFWMNGASIPTFCWAMIYSPYAPEVFLPAAVHDYGYTSHWGEKQLVDETFRELLEQYGASETKIQLIYKAVDVFGNKFWKHDEKDELYLLNLRKLIHAGRRDLKIYDLEPFS